jgi:hypothetical protein
MHVIHVAPTAFGPQGLHGGGERCPLALARALTAGAVGRLMEENRLRGNLSGSSAWEGDGLSELREAV